MVDLSDAAHGRVVVVGIGNTMRGDDAVGPAVAAALSGRIDGEVFDAGEAPENFVGPIRRANPDTVMLVDAADFGGEPGDVRIVLPSEIQGIALATHSMPLGMFMEMVSRETGARTLLVAIQVAGTKLGHPVSPQVRAAAGRLIAEFRAAFSVRTDRSAER